MHYCQYLHPMQQWLLSYSSINLRGMPNRLPNMYPHNDLHLFFLHRHLLSLRFLLPLLPHPVRKLLGCLNLHLLPLLLLLHRLILPQLHFQLRNMLRWNHLHHLLLGFRTIEQRLQLLPLKLRHLHHLIFLHNLLYQLCCNRRTMRGLHLSLRNLPISQLLRQLRCQLLPVHLEHLPQLHFQLPKLLGQHHLQHLLSRLLLQRYFLPHLGLSCTNCGTNCATCSDKEGCTKCNGGYIVNQGQCVTCSGDECTCTKLESYYLLYSYEPWRLAMVCVFGLIIGAGLV